MQNITLITSVIDPPDLPLSYTKCRSVFNKEERFAQTKKTISSIRKKIPNNKIFVVECSPVSETERNYFNEHADIFINIYDTGNKNLINRMYTKSKSMGEGTMTIIALQYLFDNNIKFDNFFKCSGRYWLNDSFDYHLYNNNYSCVRKINNDSTNAFTCFYKLSIKHSEKWLATLLSSETDFIQCAGFECIFAKFIQFMSKEKVEDVFIIPKKVGINGYVTVCGTYVDL